VLFIDLDHFKELNDTHGHDVGDLLLVQVAQRLRQHLRQSDTAARFGGDEFVVLLEGLGAETAQAARHAAAVAANIGAALNREYRFGDIRYRGGASIGFTIFPGTLDDPGQMIKEADRAMYAAKRLASNASPTPRSSPAGAEPGFPAPSPRPVTDTDCGIGTI
jgi:diguanylate cyclase (GGDEF)-like protein